MLRLGTALSLSALFFVAIASGCGDDDGGPGGTGATGATGTGGSGGVATGGQGGDGGMIGSGGDGGTGGSGGAPVGTPFVYLGLGSGDILVNEVDATTGQLSLVQTIDGGANPSFLAISPDREHMYAVNEGSNEVASFGVDTATGELTFLNRVATNGNGPTHVNVDHSGSWVFTANYGGGSISVVDVLGDGSLGTATAIPTGVQAHWVGVDPSNSFVFVPNKGSDNVSQLELDVATGAVTPNTPAAVDTASGAGPRHLAFHPSAPYAYVINELDDTMTAFAFDGTQGTLSPIQTLSTLPMGANGNQNTCAEVAFHPSGDYLYGSNRGHNSIVIYDVDASTGMLSLVGHAETDIDTPRSFAVSPLGDLLLVANQGADSISAFRIEPGTGQLTHLTTTATPASPSFVGIFDLP